MNQSKAELKMSCDALSVIASALRSIAAADETRQVSPGVWPTLATELIVFSGIELQKNKPPNNGIEQTNGELQTMTPFAAHPDCYPYSCFDLATELEWT